MVTGRLLEVMATLKDNELSVKTAKKKFKVKGGPELLEHILLLLRESKARSDHPGISQVLAKPSYKTLVDVVDQLRKECFAHMSLQFQKEGKRLLGIYNGTVRNSSPYDCMPRLEKLFLYFLSQIGESQAPAAMMGNLLKHKLERHEPIDPNFVLSGNLKHLQGGQSGNICSPLDEITNDFLEERDLWMMQAFINEGAPL